MTRRLLRTAGVTLSLAAAAAVPVVLARRAGLPPVALLSLPLAAHGAALAILAVEVAARGIRLVALASPLGVPLGLRTALLAQLAADAAGAVTPFRGGSEPAKLLSMRRDGGGLGGVAAVAVGEMVFEVGGLLVVSLLLSVVLDGGGRASLAILTYAGTVALVLTGLMIFAGRRARRGPVPSGWRRLGLRSGRWRALQTTAREFRQRAGTLRRLPAAAVVAAAAATLVHQAARAATFPALAWTAVGNPGLDWVQLTLWPFSLLYLGALLPPPGGGGGIEVGFASLLGDALPAARLPVLLLWWRVYTHLLSAAVGAGAIALLGLRRRTPSAERREEFGQHLAGERSVDDQPSAVHPTGHADPA